MLNKIIDSRLYRYVKKTPLRRIWLLLQDIHGRFDLKYGKKTILHEDLILKEIFVLVGKRFQINSAIETGTSLGYTTEFLARNFLNIPIFSCEIAKSVYLRAKKNLKKFKNIKLFLGDSIDFLKYLIKNNLIKERSLFFLDAHGVGKCPLDEEIRLISKNLKSAIMIIDDFKVDRRFEFDSYDDGDVSIERVKKNINKNKKYNVLFPNYDEKSAFRKNSYHKNLRGYAIIFQGLDEEFKKLVKEDFIKKYFIDKSEMLED